MTRSSLATNDGGEGFDEAAGWRARWGADNRRQGFETGTGQCRQRYYLIGQQDRLLAKAREPSPFALYLARNPTYPTYNMPNGQDTR